MSLYFYKCAQDFAIFIKKCKIKDSESMRNYFFAVFLVLKQQLRVARSFDEFRQMQQSFWRVESFLLSYLEGSLELFLHLSDYLFLVICFEFGRLLSYQQLLLNFRIVKNFVVVVVGILFRGHHLHWMTLQFIIFADLQLGRPKAAFFNVGQGSSKTNFNLRSVCMFKYLCRNLVFY